MAQSLINNQLCFVFMQYLFSKLIKHQFEKTTQAQFPSHEVPPGSLHTLLF